MDGLFVGVSSPRGTDEELSGDIALISSDTESYIIAPAGLARSGVFFSPSAGTLARRSLSSGVRTMASSTELRREVAVGDGGSGTAGGVFTWCSMDWMRFFTEKFGVERPRKSSRSTVLSTCKMDVVMWLLVNINVRVMVILVNKSCENLN